MINDVMEICGKFIQKQIVADKNEDGAFSILVDETADIAGHEQMLLCVCYTRKITT